MRKFGKPLLLEPSFGDPGSGGAFRRSGSPARTRWVVIASGLCTPGLLQVLRAACCSALSMPTDERSAMRRNARLSASSLSSAEWSTRLAAHLGLNS